MLTLNKNHEPTFQLLVKEVWQDWEVIENITYSSKGDFWRVRKVGTEGEHKLTREKGNELLNENKLRIWNN